MHERVIKPTDYRDIGASLLFYLNGPNQGAADWQQEAIETIQRLDTGEVIWIANPRREYLEGTFVAREQTRWERHYRQIARRQGVNLFWLAKQITPTPGRSYARTSRVEIGISLEWSLNKKNPGRIVVGIEEGFDGDDYIRDIIADDYGNFPIYSSLEETCKKAVEGIWEGKNG